MGVSSTPTLFVGGRQIANVSGMPYEALKKIAEFMGAPAGKQAASSKRQVASRK